MNKREAPSLLLEDYNYFINKAVNQYINRMYNAYDMNEQKTDDLRVLKSTVVLNPILNNDYSDSNLFGNVYEVNLPDDYLHVLGCTVEYILQKRYKCFNQGDYWQQGAIRTTGDMFPQLVNNYYLKPMYKRPYFYINNITTSSNFPTSDTQDNIKFGQYDKYTITPGINAVIATDAVVINGVTLTYVDTTPTTATQVLVGTNPIENLFKVVSSSSDASLKVCQFEYDSAINTLSVVAKTGIISAVSTTSAHVVVSAKSTIDYSFIERSEAERYGNRSKVRMEIRYGKDSKVFKLNKIYLDYLKAPQFIRLTIDEVDDVEDNSQILEYPDYVCQELVNELTKLLMENGSDPRLQSHIPINQSIAVPGQEQPQQKRK